MLKKLFKKFWHSDIVYKIYILIIAFIVIYTIIYCINRQVKPKKETIQDSTEVVETKTPEIISKEENTIESTEEKIEETNKITEENNIVAETPVVKSTDNEQVNQTTNNVAKNTIQPSANPVKNVENVENEETKSTMNPTEQPIKQIEETPVPSVAPTSNQTEQNNTKQYTEKYVVNNEMINRMKTYIENNPSDEMIKYGFEVIVDSSIKEYTNQFTYTDKRMYYALLYRAGTIRIYAEDYFVNDQLIMTECYIL